MFGKKHKKAYDQLENKFSNSNEKIRNLEESNDSDKPIDNYLYHISEVLSKGVELEKKKSQWDNLRSWATILISVVSLGIAVISVIITVQLGGNSSRREDELLRLQLDNQPLRYRIEWLEECQLRPCVENCDIILYVDAGRINNWTLIYYKRPPQRQDSYIQFSPIIPRHFALQTTPLGSGESVILGGEYLFGLYGHSYPYFFPVYRDHDIGDGLYWRNGVNYVFIYIETSFGERILDMIYFYIREIISPEEEDIRGITVGEIRRRTRVDLAAASRAYDFLDRIVVAPIQMMDINYYNLINRFRNYGLLD